MTGDPLDRIEERAQYPRLRLTLRCDEVLALVEVARAARAAAGDLLCTSTDSPCADQWGTPEWGRCADPGGEWDLCHGCSAYDAIRAALARLENGGVST